MDGFDRYTIIDEEESGPKAALAMSDRRRRVMRFAAAPFLTAAVFAGAALAVPADELPSPAQSLELVEISFGCC